MGLNENNIPNTQLVLQSPTRDSFIFADTEIPTKISLGGEQQVVVHQLPGGVRVVDAMGRSDTPLEWSGMLLGKNAMARAHFLEAMRIDGLPLWLSWAEFSYSVIIKSLKLDFEQQFQIPYSISCLVIKDLTRDTPPGQTSIDDAINGDLASAKQYGDQIGDSTLSGLLGTLDGAISSVSSFAQAAQSTINGVLAPIAAVTGRVQTLIAATGNTLANISTVGGILPFNPIAQQVASLTNQVGAMTSLPVLYNLQSVVGRMGLNLGSVSGNGQQVVAAGGNLYRMATDAYGDPNAWTGIARANGLTDPLLAGINKIMIPSLPDGAAGVFSA